MCRKFDRTVVCACVFLPQNQIKFCTSGWPRTPTERGAEPAAGAPAPRTKPLLLLLLLRGPGWGQNIMLEQMLSCRYIYICNNELSVCSGQEQHYVVPVLAASVSTFFLCRSFFFFSSFSSLFCLLRRRLCWHSSSSSSCTSSGAAQKKSGVCAYNNVWTATSRGSRGSATWVPMATNKASQKRKSGWWTMTSLFQTRAKRCILAHWCRRISVRSIGISVHMKVSAATYTLCTESRFADRTPTVHGIMNYLCYFLK
jgi:hypothetical protein